MVVTIKKPVVDRAAAAPLPAAPSSAAPSSAAPPPAAPPPVAVPPAAPIAPPPVVPPPAAPIVLPPIAPPPVVPLTSLPVAPPPTTIATTATAATPANPTASPPAKPSWLLSGDERKAVMAQAEAQAALAKEQQNSLWRWRWRLRLGEQGQLTWLDGALDGEGLLAGQSFWQHTRRINQRWENFVCVAQFGREPCPICEAGEKPAFVTVFTVIDHRPYQIQNGPKAGQVIQDQRKLFVAKANDLALLQFQATALGGLAGHRFTVGRLGTSEKQTSAVGNQFVPMGQQTPLGELARRYGEHGVAADYETEIPILSAVQLVQLGAGRSAVGPGYPVGAAATVFDAQAMAAVL